MDFNIFPKNKIGHRLKILCNPLLGCVKSSLWLSIIFMILIADQLYESAHETISIEGLPPVQSLQVLIGGFVMVIGVCTCSTRLQNGLNELKKSQSLITETDYILTGVGFYLVNFIWVCFVLSYMFSYYNLGNFYKGIGFYISLLLIFASFYIIKYCIFKKLHMKV